MERSTEHTPGKLLITLSFHLHQTDARTCVPRKMKPAINARGERVQIKNRGEREGGRERDTDAKEQKKRDKIRGGNKAAALEWV